MRYLKYLTLLAVLAVPTVYSHAQVAVGVQIGPSYGIYNPPPVCAYGYYPYYPYTCAPYGYWGPDWFVSGVFIGAGPWYDFYYSHPGYWRGYYGRFYGRSVGFRGDRDFFRGRDFRGDREFRDGFRFREGGRFRDERGFRENRSFRSDRGFRSGGGFRESRGGGREGHGRGR
jgi:hypothetical protein